MIEIIPNWHPIFVHFTVALLSISTLLFVVGKLLPATVSWKHACFTAARCNLWLGVTITIGTLLAGWLAFNTVNHDGHSHLAMLSHRNWAIPTAGIFIVLGLWSFLLRKKEPGLLLILSLLVAMLPLTVTAYKGGELVFRHGLGVMSLPQAKEHEHSSEQHKHETNAQDDDHNKHPHSH